MTEQAALVDSLEALLAQIAALNAAVAEFQRGYVPALDMAIAEVDQLSPGTDRDSALQAAAEKIGQLQETVARVQAELDALHSDTARIATVAPPHFGQVQEAVMKMQAQYKEIGGALDSLNRIAAMAAASRHLEKQGRSADGWKRRWKRDWTDAQAAYREVAARAERSPPTGVPEFLTDLSDKDLAIADLYYRAGLSQTEVGRLMGLAQPSVASRLQKADRAIAEEVLKSRLEAVAEREGWSIARNARIPAARGDRYDVMADLYAERADGTAFIIEVKVAHDDSLTLLTGWPDYAGRLKPLTHAAVALYDRTQISTGLYIEKDLKEAAEKLPTREPGFLMVKYAEIRPLLVGDLSLNSAAERAAS